MAALASPECGLPAGHKEEDCDKDSGHHSGEELEPVQEEPEPPETSSRRNSFTEEIKARMSSRRSSACSSAAVSRRQSGAGLTSRRGSYVLARSGAAQGH
jgi:hypothetical protein